MDEHAEATPVAEPAPPARESRVPLSPLSEPGVPADRDLGQLEQRTLEHFFALNPASAVYLGLHAYDGQLPDLSPSATDAWLAEAEKILGVLDGFPARLLPAGRRIDVDRLRFLLRRQIFDLVDVRSPERNPAAYLFQVGLTVYQARNYAAKEERVNAMTRLLEATPKFLAQARTRLREPLPQPFVTLGIDVASGLPPHYADSQEWVGTTPVALVREFRRARQEAEAAAGEFYEFLKATLSGATPEFALGPLLFQKLLVVTEGLTTPWEVLLDEAWQDLRRNQRRLAEVARALTPTRTAAEAIRSLRDDHPAPEAILEEARKAVEETRALILEKKFVSLPNEVPCRVETMPPMERAFAFAMMGASGPFEPRPDTSVYYINPLDPAWDAARKDQWLAFFNRSSLGIITAHETYPGHHVQALHWNSRPLSTAAKSCDSSFTEGWAHYTEQLAIEQGFRKGQPTAEVAQLREALLRDCRMIASISMHAMGMPLAEAEQLFQREGYTEPAIARLESRRGTFNPEYYAYTMGKLAILRTRTRYFRERPSGSLLEFHDRLLAQGSPPVGLLDRLVLEDGAPPS